MNVPFAIIIIYPVRTLGRIKINDMNPDALEYKRMEASSLYYTQVTWGLVPQPLKPEYYYRFQAGLTLKHKEWDAFCATVTKDWFMPYQDGMHLTWQQSLVLYGVDKAVRGECSLRISIVSGHGIGKSMILSIIILWFLFIHPFSQVACTSPGKEQMYDVLWKELKKWIDRMPPQMAALYEWQNSHVRMKEASETWFARAKTASKENTEALAGVHADWVLIAVDEASGVDEAIFETMEGSLTSGNILVFLISNGTRSEGYFYATHPHGKNGEEKHDSERWQNYSFSSLDSPRVDQKYVDGIIAKYGADSEQYNIRVLGKFPKSDMMDDSGYVPLLNENSINFQPDFGELVTFSTLSVMGVDPAGEGDDKTSWVIRDNFKAKKIYEEAKSTPQSIAERTLTLMELYGISDRNVVVDSFGVGADVGKHIAIASRGKANVYTVNAGEVCQREIDQELYINKRAEMYYKLKKWMQSGGEIVQNDNVKTELLTIKYKRALNGKIQIMSKLDMRKKYGFKSPNDADALALTFLRDIPKVAEQEVERARQIAEGEEDWDPFAVI